MKDELIEIIKLNLEDNPYFDIVSIEAEEVVIVNSNVVLQENTKYKFTITEIFGEDSLFWKQKYNGVAASELQNIEIRDKTVYINRKLIATIAKKYDFVVKDFGGWYIENDINDFGDDNENEGGLEIYFTLLK